MATCEPRLFSLFRRSFPHIHFVSVQRRWPDLPMRLNDDRSEIDDLDFARVVTADLFRQIPSFDELRYQQDLIAAIWSTEPDGEPRKEGAEMAPI